MKFLSKKVAIIMAAGTIVALGICIAANLGVACKLEAVVLNDNPQLEWKTELSLLSPKSVLRQPLDSLATLLLADPDCYKVDVRYGGLNTIKIATNNFNPACFMLDAKSGQLYGLDNVGRLLPLDHAPTDWEKPIISGLNSWPVFTAGDDGRVPVLMQQLQLLKKREQELYRLISGIELRQPGYADINIAGLHYRLRLMPDELVVSVERWIEFMTRFEADLDSVSLLDLRFDDMIICAEGKVNNG